MCGERHGTIMQRRCRAARIVLLIVGCALISGCAQPRQSTRIVRKANQSVPAPTIDVGAEIDSANYEMGRGDVAAAERHLTIASKASLQKSEKLRVQEMLATVYELQGNLPASEVCWRQCVGLVIGADGKVCDAALDYMRSRARVLRLLGKQDQATTIDDEIAAYKFDQQQMREGILDKDAAKGSEVVISDVVARKCPKCGAANGSVPVVYGAPTDALIQDEARGKVLIGGMVPMSEKFYCKSCQSSW